MFTFVAKNSLHTTAAGSTTISVQLTGIVAGDLIVVGVRHGAAATVTVSDGTSSLPQQNGAFYNQDGGTDAFGRMFYLLASVATGTVTYTATFSTSMGGTRDIFAFAYRPGQPVRGDGANHNGSTAGLTAVTSGSITTTGTNEVVFGAYWYVGGNDTTGHQINGLAADQVQKSVSLSFSAMWSKTFTAPFTGGASCTLTSSPNWWGSSMIAFKEGTATTIPAASLNFGDVQAALDQAIAGDTVLLPAGTGSWTGRVSLVAPPNVTLKGAGTSATGGGNLTTIVDSVGVSSSTQLLNISVPSTGVFRLTGITFQSGTLGGFNKDSGTINFEGPGNIRIDHCHFNMADSGNYKVLRLGTGVFGVIDHCILELYSTNAIYLYNGRVGGGGDIQGHYEWTLPTNFGSAEYFYIEDNIINGYSTAGDAGRYASRAYDMFTASKAVIRFNTVNQACLGETHATGHGPDDRGGRSQEVYGNTATSSLVAEPNFTAIDIENGTTLVWGNSWDQVYKSIYKFKVVRRANPPDESYSQSPTPTGWGYAGTQENGVGSDWDGGTKLGTDTLKGYPCIDQPGRGPGDLLTGMMPTLLNNVTGTIYWPHQALEPIYIWANVGGLAPGSWGGAEYSDTTDGRVVSDRDYYRQASGIQTSPTSPFNGTTGVGWGTLANRPATCTAGVAYFATDAGSWNKSSSNPYGVQQNGKSGVLYKATATNTWTLYYTPYTYPHPLQGGVESSGPGISSSGTLGDCLNTLLLKFATNTFVAGGIASDYRDRRYATLFKIAHNTSLSGGGLAPTLGDNEHTLVYKIANNYCGPSGVNIRDNEWTLWHKIALKTGVTCFGSQYDLMYVIAKNS